MARDMKTDQPSGTQDSPAKKPSRGRGNFTGRGGRPRASVEEIDVENSITTLLARQKRPRPGRQPGNSALLY